MDNIPIENRLAVRTPPESVPIMHQDWRNLLFLHWKYDKDHLQKLLPSNLYIDTYESDAYITIAPFFIKNFRIMQIPYGPFSRFVEINVRTYVYDKNGIPGVWFFSLDFSDVLGTFGAKMFFSLPYIHAQFSAKQNGNLTSIKGYRPKFSNSAFEFNYQSNQPFYEAKPNTLDFFLIERYGMYSYHKMRGLRFYPIHHKPYLISKDIKCEFTHNFFSLNNLENKNQQPDLMHFSNGVDVNIYKSQKILL